MAKTLTLPPFPPLRWDKPFWEGAVRLDSWRGFQTRQGPYGSVSSDDASAGTVRLSVSPPDDEEMRPPSPEQARAFQHLLDNEQAIHDAVLQAILDDYPRLREAYAYDEEEAEEVMPAVERVDQFKRLIGLSIVHVLAGVKDGFPCVGFEFGCTWDEEHGLGVLTHRVRVIEVGAADTSFADRYA